MHIKATLLALLTALVVAACTPQSQQAQPAYLLEHQAETPRVGFDGFAQPPQF